MTATPTTPGSPSPTPAPAVHSRWRKITRRVGLAAIVLLVLLGAVFFLLPVWISNEQGRLYILDRLNDRLHGPKVAVDQWSLGWFRTTELHNLKVMQPDGTTLLTCPHVTSGLTLWDIFWSNYDIRNTTADELEIRIAKNADGTTSLDSLAQGAADILQSARGALQIKEGRMTIVSDQSGESVRYGQVNATISIASPDAPFAVHISAVGVPGGAGADASEKDAGGGGSLALDATFPPTSTLSMRNLEHPGIWALLSDIDFSANRVPTGLACDFFNLDGAWKESFGESLEKFQFTARTPPGQDTHLTLLVRGGGGGGMGEAPMVDASLLLHPPAKGGNGGASLSMPALADYRLMANLRFSPPLGRLLRRLNPILGEATASGKGGGGGGGLVKASATAFKLALDHPEDADVLAKVTFPPLIFAARDGPSIVRQLRVVTGELTRPATPSPAGPAPRLDGSADLLVVRLADRNFSYQNFGVTLGRSRIVFTGTVTLDGNLNLLATLPDTSSGLAAENSRVLITGTTEVPVIKRAE